MYTCTGICGCVDINGCTTFVRKYLKKHNLGQIRGPEDLVSINRMVIKTKYWSLEAKERHFVLPSFMFSSSSNERLSLIVRRVKMVFVNGKQIFSVSSSQAFTVKEECRIPFTVSLRSYSQATRLIISCFPFALFPMCSA